MEEALYEVAPLRRFAGLSLTRDSVPDETTILNFRRLIDTHDLAPKVLATINAYLTGKGLLLRQGTTVEATIIHARRLPPRTLTSRAIRRCIRPASGGSVTSARRAHIGVDAESGLVHTVTTTAANVADVAQVAQLQHGKEKTVYADAGYIGAEKRASKRGRKWHIAAKRGSVKAMHEGELKKTTKQFEYLKSTMRSKVEHPFRVINRQFGYQKVRFKGLAKNTAQILALFALSNLWMMRRTLASSAVEVRP